MLLVPEEAIPDDMDIEDFADEWSKYNGVIKYRAKDGVKQPGAGCGTNFNVGQFDMINLQMKLMNDIGGVTMLCRVSHFGTALRSSLYQQAVHNSQTNILDYMESFAWLLMKRLQDGADYQAVLHRHDVRPVCEQEVPADANYYDPALVRNYDFYNESQGQRHPCGSYVS